MLAPHMYWNETAGNQLHFMDPQTYEQEAVDVQLFGDQHNYFVEDLEATLSFHDGEAIAGSLAPWTCRLSAMIAVAT